MRAHFRCIDIHYLHLCAPCGLADCWKVSLFDRSVLLLILLSDAPFEIYVVVVKICSFIHIALLFVVLSQFHLL